MRKTSYIRMPRIAKKRGFSAHAQLEKIVSSFPDSEILKSKGESFEIVISLRPTTWSRNYQIKIVYKKYGGVDVYVINEVLEVAKNRTKLPHVYSHSDQRLCLYSVSKEEWTREKLIVSTIIPWISDWLFYYELWLPNGKWLGGGHDEYRED